MTRILLRSVHDFDALFRQTPQNDGVWKRTNVTFEDPEGQAEWLVVYDRHKAPLNTTIPKNRRILIVAEPPEFQNYSAAYLDQFGILCAPEIIEAFNGIWIQTQTGLPWFYGLVVGGAKGAEKEHDHGMDWAQLSAPTADPANRDLELTAICSKKTQTKNQVRRLRFLAMLKAELGDRMKIYGRGFEPLDDKAEIINRSRYHLALENNLQAFGWTEKTADPILGGAYVIHGGAREIEQDFDQRGMQWIDLKRPKEAVRTVLACLERDPLSQLITQQAMLANKQRLMNEHNLFALLSRVIDQLDASNKKIAPLDEPQMLVENKKSRLSKLFKLPRALRQLVWQIEVAMLERN